MRLKAGCCVFLEIPILSAMISVLCKCIRCFNWFVVCGHVRSPWSRIRVSWLVSLLHEFVSMMDSTAVAGNLVTACVASNLLAQLGNMELQCAVSSFQPPLMDGVSS